MSKKRIIKKTPPTEMTNADYAEKHGDQLPKGYDEDQPTDAGKKLNKKPDKQQKKNPSGRKGKHGSATIDGPGQEVRKLRRSD